MRRNNVIRPSGMLSTVLVATVALLACILLTPARTSDPVQTAGSGSSIATAGFVPPAVHSIGEHTQDGDAAAPWQTAAASDASPLVGVNEMVGPAAPEWSERNFVPRLVPPDVPSISPSPADGRAGVPVPQDYGKTAATVNKDVALIGQRVSVDRLLDRRCRGHGP